MIDVARPTRCSRGCRAVPRTFGGDPARRPTAPCSPSGRPPNRLEPGRRAARSARCASPELSPERGDVCVSLGFVCQLLDRHHHDVGAVDVPACIQVVFPGCSRRLGEPNAGRIGQNLLLRLGAANHPRRFRRLCTHGPHDVLPTRPLMRKDWSSTTTLHTRPSAPRPRRASRSPSVKHHPEHPPIMPALGAFTDRGAIGHAPSSARSSDPSRSRSFRPVASSTRSVAGVGLRMTNSPPTSPSASWALSTTPRPDESKSVTPEKSSTTLRPRLDVRDERVPEGSGTSSRRRRPRRERWSRRRPC